MFLWYVYFCHVVWLVWKKTSFFQKRVCESMGWALFVCTGCPESHLLKVKLNTSAIFCSNLMNFFLFERARLQVFLQQKKSHRYFSKFVRLEDSIYFQCLFVWKKKTKKNQHETSVYVCLSILPIDLIYYWQRRKAARLRTEEPPAALKIAWIPPPVRPRPPQLWLQQSLFLVQKLSEARQGGGQPLTVQVLSQ